MHSSFSLEFTVSADCYGQKSSTGFLASSQRRSAAKVLPSGNVPGSASPAACLGGGTTVKRQSPAHPQSLQQGQLKHFSLFRPPVLNASGFDEMPQEAPSQKNPKTTNQNSIWGLLQMGFNMPASAKRNRDWYKTHRQESCDFLSSTDPSFDFQLKTFHNLTHIFDCAAGFFQPFYSKTVIDFREAIPEVCHMIMSCA